MAGEAFTHHANYVLRDGIRLEPKARWQVITLSEWLAVFAVEIPLAANGVSAFHQKAGLASHLAVEKLHAELLLALGPLGKLSRCGQKPRIVSDLDGQAERVLPIQHELPDPIFTGLGYNQPAGTMALDSAGDFIGKGAGIVGIIEFYIIDGDASLGQFIGEMAHGRKDKGNFLLVVRHINRLACNLDHQHHIAGRVEIG